MTILFTIETHAYAEERLCDEILNEKLGDDIDSCGIVAPEIILPLRKKRSNQLLFEYTEKTTLSDVSNAIYAEYGLLEFAESYGLQLALWHNGLRYWIDNSSANFKAIVDNHLDPNGSGQISAALYISADAGRIDEKDGIRYYMNSREKGRHHEPHVHVFAISSCKDGTVIIKTGEVIGDFPKKLAKIARERVLSEQRFFLEQWNVLTDGLSVDVDHYLGLINY